MGNWRTLKRRIVLEEGEYLKVEMHQVELPDGRVIERWPWVVTPDFVTVVVMTGDGQFLFFRQGKYAAEGEGLAPPGGYIDAGEAPLAAAQRELLEEMGARATQWYELGAFPVDGNRGCGVAHFYLATGAEYVAEPNADDLEAQTLLTLTRDEVTAALDDGAFKVLPWAAVVALALRHPATMRDAR